MAKKEQCYFCTSNMRSVDYKDTEVLKRFMSPQSKIMARRKTSTCSTHQRKLSRAIKRARQMALVPFVTH
ncbi:MAG: 30S ribosomal protein S18 [Candidatus Niyogibacteria bacterium RIFCSPLOWO2_01_FULL_45_48]|uniref:Small ribosomal subunit protein bS18 n=1 Tax=Candidatus Niyogibacteria bacterium RIFCSPLOWO2_01_FULL_45_48 TaxID=1801724 RepID=A0A1G2EWG1_9BACT|nr:MAG: 30S ribosomal protein S18 [Candidatus Niyogibacteria bacterium RIFCSPLOWO2_01_FULL_45_48]